MAHKLYKPRPLSVSYLKSKILRPATTSHFQCWFPPPAGLINDFIQKKQAGIDFTYNADTQELISLNCIEATLPGSTFATTEINDDYTGVTERIAYRRQYDDRADFTFTVDYSEDNKNNNHYSVILFFELWKKYIANEQESDDLESPNYFYRVKFPNSYQAPYIIINKFERDYNKVLQYKFIQAYPLAINSIPLSSESSQRLQMTVSINYTRYTVKTYSMKGFSGIQQSNLVQQSRSIPSIPEPPAPGLFPEPPR